MSEREPGTFRRTLGPGAVRADDEADVREELELYVELRTEELVGEGMDPEAARREAEARFGDRREIERRVRRQRRRWSKEGGRRMMGNLRADLRYAFRTLRRGPGFAAVAALTLALPIAGNSAIFSVFDAAILRSLPFPEHDRLVFVNGYHLSGGEVAIRNASVPEFRDWRERSRTVSPMVAVDAYSVTLSGDGAAERITAELVSRGFFEVLGGEALLGRTLTPEEAETPEGHPVVVLSHDLWRRRFASDPGVVGQTLELNDRALTVLGVMEEGFRGISSGVDAWIPLGMMSVVRSAAILDARGTRFLPVMGRLAPGRDLAAAQAELDAIAVDLQREHPDRHEDRWAQLQPFREAYLGPAGPVLWLLVAAGGLLLAIAAANVANLLLVRAHARTRELVVRRAMGAEGTRVVGQLLTESVVLAALGGALGLVLAWWCIDAFSGLIPPGVLPDFATPAPSARVFAFSLAVIAGVGLVAGLVPALSSARGDLAALLRAGGRGGRGRRSRAQRVFVVTQVALALLLLIGAGLLGRSLRAQLAVDPGLEMQDVHVFRISFPRERYPDAAAVRLATDELLRRVGAVPGVRSVAASSDFPFRGGSSGSQVILPDSPEESVRYFHHAVTPGYFEQLGVELLRGRWFTETDDESAPGVAIVTQALVDRLFPDDPSGLGRMIYLGDPSNPENGAEIVGVVGNVRYRNLTQDMMAQANSPDVFFTLRQLPTRTLEVSLLAPTGLTAVLPSIREAVAGFDSGLAIFRAQSLVDAYRAQTATARFASWLMGILSSLALVLACVGLYGVLSFAVGQRAREIAIRRAVGASGAEVAGSVVAEALGLAGVGVAAGALFAFAGGRLLDAFLFGVAPSDPRTFVVVAGAMMAVAALAASIPALRASRHDPALALNTE